MYETETEEINKILKKLSLKEKTTFNLEFRKWRIIYVINTIKNIDKNDYISGLIELGDLWEKLGYPQDTPHIIQGRFNTFTPEEYYTEENYKFLLIKHKIVRIVIAVLFCLTAFCLTLTYARGACLSIALVIFVYSILYNRKVLLALIGLAVILLLSDATLVDRMTSIFTKMDTSSEMRLAFWESTIAMILDHPLLGIGWGSYFMVYPNYDYYMQGNFIKIVHAHNMYLNFMAEIGLFGFASYMVCFFGVIYKAFKAQVMKLDILVKAMFLGIGLGLSALALNGFTDYVMFNTELSMLVWLFSGIVVSGYKN